jgi:hypothetical protein
MKNSEYSEHTHLLILPNRPLIRHFNPSHPRSLPQSLLRVHVNRTMNNQSNSPTSKRLSTPSNSSSTTLTRRIILPIFDLTKLPNWNEQQRQVLEETALKELEIQRRPSFCDQINQDLPTDIGPDGGPSLTETTRTMGTIRDVQNDNIGHRMLREIPLRTIQTDDARSEDRRPSQERDEGTHHTGAVMSSKFYRSFDHLRTTDEVFDWITYLA